MPFRVFVTRPIPAEAIDRLIRAGCEVEVGPADRALSREELRRAVRDRDAVVCQLADRMDADILRAGRPRCRVFANCAAGFENFDLDAARSLGLWITNSPDALTETTADLAWALTLAAARRLGEGEREVRAGRWSGWTFEGFLGQDVHGKTLGIIGFGRIGRGVARRAAGFAMRVIYVNRSEVAPDRRHGASPVSLDELLAVSDFISIHAPLTPQTRHLIDAAALRRMKPTVVLVNTARGAIIDEAALVEALRTGVIAAAGLDVYEHEPRLSPGLAELENVVLLPHIGSATLATRIGIAVGAVENVLAVLAGRRPPNPVVEPAPG